MIDPVRTLRRIIHIGREDKALQRCTLSARSMPGDGQEHRPWLVLLPSDPSSGRKATNLLNWGAAPSQAKEQNYPRAVGHMSRLVVLLSPEKVAFLRLTAVLRSYESITVDLCGDILATQISGWNRGDSDGTCTLDELPRNC